MKLMIVDDSASARMLIRMEMEDYPEIEILEASNGKEAIELAIKHAPDVITMDIEMPELGGLEAIARIRYYPQCSHIPIIVITSSTDIETSKKAYQAGAIEFMRKPFSPGSLREYIESVVSPPGEFDGINILVADDAKAIRQIISRILTQHGASVFAVENGEEAVDCMKDNEIDLIITDFVMPGMDGLELCRHVRDTLDRQDLPIIMITAAGEYSVVIESLKSGADDCLTKPFSREELLARIRNHIRMIHFHQKIYSIQQQLIQSAKMASLGEMSAGMAHELSNPLGIIKFSIAEARELLEDGEEAELPAILDRINRHVDRSTNIINHLRTYGHDARQQEKENCAIRGIIENSLQFFSEQLMLRGIDLELEPAESLPPVLCIALQIEQVLVNLVSNARDAFEEETPEKQIRLRAHEMSGFVVVEIQDNGRGIPEKILKDIFNPFFTTKAPGQGTGLGLSISYGIVKEHGGKLEVESKIGEGTTVRVSLPVTPSQDAKPDDGGAVIG